MDDLLDKAIRQRNEYRSAKSTEEKKEVVILLKVLASEMSRGHTDFKMWAIEKINGETFDSFSAFYHKMKSFKGKFIVLEDKDGVELVIDAQKAKNNQSSILKKYNIEFDKSIDLRE